MKELYKRYRPKSLKAVYGQDEAVKVLQKFLQNDDVPHALLFIGPSGVGKTTLARILKTEMDCSDEDCEEINAAENRGIEVVRAISSRMRLAPISGKCRIFILDEAHQLVRKAGGDAQTALLKTLEEPPKHVYFILCTTNPKELLETIRNRCTQVKLNSVSAKALEELVKNVCEKEKKKLTENVVIKLVDAAEGSPRKALVLLHQIIQLDTEEEQLDAISKADGERAAIELVQHLMRRSKWSEIATILKSVDEPEESLRRMILGYCSKVLLGGGAQCSRAMQIMDVMRDNLYDSGKPGLIANCFELCNSK